MPFVNVGFVRRLCAALVSCNIKKLSNAVKTFKYLNKVVSKIRIYLSVLIFDIRRTYFVNSNI